MRARIDYFDEQSKRVTFADFVEERPFHAEQVVWDVFNQFPQIAYAQIWREGETEAEHELKTCRR